MTSESNQEEVAAMNAMTYCQDAGLDGVVDVSYMTFVSVEDLVEWYVNEPELFTVVVAGTLAIKERGGVAPGECPFVRLEFESRPDIETTPWTMPD